MRLQLIPLALAVACVVALASPSALAAEPAVSVDARGSIYQDSDRTTIITNNVAARGNPSDHVGVDARWLVDVITSASVDVVSAATTAFHETRHEVEGGGERRVHDLHREAGHLVRRVGVEVAAEPVGFDGDV